MGLILAADGVLVDAEVAAHRSAAGVVALTHHCIATAIQSAVVAPDDDVTTVGQHRDVRFILVAAGVAGVDQDFATELGAGAVEALQVDPGAAAILVLGAPGDDERAIRARGDARLVLPARGGGVDAELGAVGAAVVVVPLRVDAVAAAVLGVGVPGDDEAAGVGGDAGLRLVVGDEAVDTELGARGLAGGIEALRVDAVGAAVDGGAVGPDNGEAAVREPGRLGLELVARVRTVDPELGPDRHAAGAVALAVDAVVAAILAARGPDDDVTAVVGAKEPRHAGRVLVVGRVGVDLVFKVGRRRAVQLTGDVDGDDAAEGGSAVAVVDADADLARGRRAAAAVAVAQALDELLDGVQAGVGVEVDGQVGAVCAIAAAADRADVDAAVADGAAGYADLTGQVALVCDAELVFGHGAGLDVIELDAAAAEIGGVGVSQAHRRVQHLQAGVDRVFGEGDGAAEVAQHRVGLAAEVRRVPENLLIDAVAAAVLIVRRPQHDVIALPQIGHHRLQLAIRAAVVGIHLLFAGDGTAGGIVFPGVDLVVPALGGHVIAVPGDDEAAGGQTGHIGIALVVIGRHVDAELAAGLGTGCVVTLAVDAVTAAVLATRLPDDDETTVGQRCHARRELVVGSRTGSWFRRC